jgi:hypothetical protein
MIDLRKMFFVVGQYETHIPYNCFKTEKEAKEYFKYTKQIGILILNFEGLRILLDKNNYALYGLNFQ